MESAVVFEALGRPFDFLVEAGDEAFHDWSHILIHLVGKPSAVLLGLEDVGFAELKEAKIDSVPVKVEYRLQVLDGCGGAVGDSYDANGDGVCETLAKRQDSIHLNSLRLVAFGCRRVLGSRG